MGKGKFKAFIKHLWASVTVMFHNLTDEVQKDSQLAVTLVDKIKAGVPIELILSFVPADKAEKIRSIITKVIPEMHNINDKIQGFDDDKILESIRNILDNSPELVKNLHLNSWATLLTDALSDGKLDWSDLFLIPKWVYDNIIKKKNVNETE